jgi:hypothetical protein
VCPSTCRQGLHISSLIRSDRGWRVRRVSLDKKTGAAHLQLNPLRQGLTGSSCVPQNADRGCTSPAKSVQKGADGFFARVSVICRQGLYTLNKPQQAGWTVPQALLAFVMGTQLMQFSGSVTLYNSPTQYSFLGHSHNLCYIGNAPRSSSPWEGSGPGHYPGHGSGMPIPVKEQSFSF